MNVLHDLAPAPLSSLISGHSCLHSLPAVHTALLTFPKPARHHHSPPRVPVLCPLALASNLAFAWLAPSHPSYLTFSVSSSQRLFLATVYTGTCCAHTLFSPWHSGFRFLQASVTVALTLLSLVASLPPWNVRRSLFALFVAVLCSPFLALAWHVVGTSLKLPRREGRERKEGEHIKNKESPF